MTVGPQQAPPVAATLFEEDLTSGVLSGDPGGTWEFRAAEDLPSGDGLVRGSPDGCIVVPTAVNPATGEPAFRAPADAEARTSPLRWAAFVRHTSSRGFPGFDVATAGVLTCMSELAARTYGADKGLDPKADTTHEAVRGAAALITVDHETGMVFDLVFTNTTVYALYERLPREGSSALTFSYAVPVCERKPDQFHRGSISLDGSGGVVRWVLDGNEVLSVDKIGYAVLDDSCLLWRGEGSEHLVRPGQLSLGLCMFATKMYGQGVKITVRRMSVATGPA